MYARDGVAEHNSSNSIDITMVYRLLDRDRCKEGALFRAFFNLQMVCHLKFSTESACSARRVRAFFRGIVAV